MRISFIGAGNMAGAIINSLIANDSKKSREITVFDIDKSKYDKFKILNISFADDLKEACEASTFILLAVKPQDYSSLLEKIKACCKNSKDKIFISIAAGISTDFVCNALGVVCPVIRVMPNTPMLLGYGATAISRNSLVEDKDFANICNIFAASGIVSVLPEDKMNAVISVNSSSPAYVYLFAKALIEGGVRQGIDEKTSRELAYQAIMGAAQMLISSGDMTPDELIKIVASPKGTTEKALESLNSSSFTEIIISAMLACTERAEEMKK